MVQNHTYYRYTKGQCPASGTVLLLLNTGLNLFPVYNLYLYSDPLESTSQDLSFFLYRLVNLSSTRDSAFTFMLLMFMTCPTTFEAVSLSRLDIKNSGTAMIDVIHQLFRSNIHLAVPWCIRMDSNLQPFVS